LLQEREVLTDRDCGDAEAIRDLSRRLRPSRLELEENLISRSGASLWRHI
jgi:hypothetical protein